MAPKLNDKLTPRQRATFKALRLRYDTVVLEENERGVQAFCHGPKGLAIFPLRP